MAPAECDKRIRRDLHEEPNGPKRGEFARGGRRPRLTEAQEPARTVQRLTDFRKRGYWHDCENGNLRQIYRRPRCRPNQVVERQVEVVALFVVGMRLGRRSRLLRMVVVVAVVGVLVPVLVHMGATERQRLAAQAGHGQQGRDQNRHEDAMRVNDHGTKVTIRQTVVNSSESIPLVPLKSMGDTGFEPVTPRV